MYRTERSWFLYWLTDILEHDTVQDELKTFKSLSFAADNSAGIVRGDLDSQFGTFFFHTESAVEPEIIINDGVEYGVNAADERGIAVCRCLTRADDKRHEIRTR